MHRTMCIAEISIVVLGILYSWRAKWLRSMCAISNTNTIHGMYFLPPTRNRTSR